MRRPSRKGVPGKAKESMAGASAALPEDGKLAEWKKQLNTLGEDLYRLAHIDDVFWQTHEIMKTNPDLERYAGTFVAWMADCYLDSATIRLRRLADRRQDVLSLVTVFRDMEEHSHLLTREAYVTRSARHLRDLDHPDDLAHTDFDGLAGKNCGVIAVDLIRAQRDLFLSKTERIRNHTNKHVAHRDAGQPAVDVTFGDAREAIVAAFVAFRWCLHAVTGAELISPVPVIQHAWTKVFRVPWLPARKQPPPYRHLNEVIKEAEGGQHEGEPAPSSTRLGGKRTTDRGLIGKRTADTFPDGGVEG